MFYPDPSAETRCAMLEDAISSIYGAIDSLQHKSGYFSDVIWHLENALEQAKEELEKAEAEYNAECDRELY